MEAKDTVILDDYKVETQELLNRQAEISFKAGKQEGIKEVVEWIKTQQLFLGEEPEEGKPYQFLACYITKWGRTDEPTLALVRFSENKTWQSKLQEWGIF